MAIQRRATGDSDFVTLRQGSGLVPQLGVSFEARVRYGRGMISVLLYDTDTGVLLNSLSTTVILLCFRVCACACV